MPKSKPVDRIVIRYWKGEESNPVALFMDMPEGRGMVNSYQHVGQHSVADPAIVHDTKACKPDDVHALALVSELRRIGYNPRVMRRMQRA